ncbi:hypothetical protein [Maricaulis parjimensis]|uniref:hypothetical protein n=1 Tax=Maricaulis parjimensis TaxID=144023 RepID=UPI001939BF14|nr:hypothetical protein [Maricaulis parjimensis]
MIIWSGDGLGAFVVLLIWCVVGIACFVLAANLVYPDNPDSVTLAFVNHAGLVALPVGFAVAGSVHIWIWGRRVNSESVEHTLYGFPIESFPILSVVLALTLTGYTLFTSPIDRMSDQFERACKANLIDLNYPQCECMAAELASNLPTPVLAALSRTSGHNSRTPLLERFEQNELPRFTPVEQTAYTSGLAEAFEICLPRQSGSED